MVSKDQLEKNNVEDIMVLSPIQEGMLFHYLKDPEDVQYIEQLSLRIVGRLDVDFVKAAWNHVADTNEMLRTLFRWKGLDKPIQITLKKHEIPFLLVDLSMKDGGLDYEIEKIKQSDIDKKIDLSREPFRITLIKLKEEEYHLLITNHHILYDGWSTGILIKEFLQTYQNLVSGLDGVKVNKNKYKEFIKYINGQNKDDQKNFWENYFKGVNEVTPLSSSPATLEKSNRSTIGKLTHTLPKELTEQVNQFCKQNQITTATLLYTLWGILLQRYTNKEDIIFGTTLSGRPSQLRGITEMVGLFINTLPLRFKGKGTEDLITLLKDMEERLKEREAFQNTPLINVKEFSGLKNEDELFEHIVVIENYPLDQQLRQMDGGIKVEGYSMTESTNYNFVLGISLFEEMEIQLSLQYRDDLDGNISKILEHYTNILIEVIHHPEKELQHIEMLSSEEKQQILEGFNDTSRDYPRDKTLHQCFEEQVEKTPDNTAVIFQENQLTYRELNEKANQLARLLVEKGVKEGAIVGIMVERSLEMVIGLMAIVKAGGAYLPMDPEYPMDRIKYMMGDSDAKIVLTQSWLQEKLQDGDVVLLDDHQIYQGDGGNLNLNQSLDSLAYMIYTSGSTGKPKGVMIRHYSLVNRLNWMQNQYPIGEEDVILQKTPFTFDVSLWELFWWSMVGAKVCMLEPSGEKNPKTILEAIEGNKITTMHFVPSMLSAFLEYGEYNLEKYNLHSLNKVFASGESLTKHQVQQFNKLITSKYKATLTNLYGPTEATVDVTYFDCDGVEELNSIPIGKPIDNIKLYIVGPNMKMLPIGVAGELCISGDGLARGYLNRPELTAEKFIDNPFEVGEKMYRTGDLARWKADGNIEFLGRIDHQVKIRGYRIELGEIENQLMNYPVVEEAVVIARDDEGGVKSLCGYIVAKEDVDIVDLKQALLQELPQYMIPSQIIQLETFPLTSNGKIDRRALPDPGDRILTKVKYEAPRDEIEEELVNIWQEILSIDGVGITHNFFELGGHSLKATRMVSKIHKKFNVEVPLKVVFENPTIKVIAEYIIKINQLEIEEGSMSVASSVIPQVEEMECYPASAAQKRLYTLQQFDPQSTSYNISGAVMLEGRLDKDVLEEVFSRLVQRHEIIRTSLRMKEDELVQVVHKSVDFKIQHKQATEVELEKVTKAFIKPFNLEKAPLMRVGLVEISPEKHLLLLDLHHIISDGESMDILIKEFMELYKGSRLEELKIQYKDYSVWQQQLLSSEKIVKQKEYWRQQFKEEVPVLNLMGDYPRPSIQSFEGDKIPRLLEGDLTKDIKKICQETGTTLYMVLLTAFNILLSKYTAQEDIVVGSPIAGRHHSGLDNIMGMFVNTLAMRNYPEGEKTFKGFLNEVKDNALKAFENQDYQLEELIEDLNIQRDMGRNPLFDVMFTMQNTDRKQLEMEGIFIKPYPVQNSTSKFDITLEATEVQNHIHFEIEYSTKIYKRETMENFFQHYRNILKQIVTKPEIKIKQIDLMDWEEKQLILGAFNNTEVPRRKDQVIHQLFEEQVEKNPNKIALIFEDQKLTYGELNKKANQLARYLVEKGVEPDSIVAIMADRSLEMMVGIMATLKAGAGYMPISPEYPAERIKYMLEDSGAKILLTQNHLRAEKNLEGFEGEVVSLEDTGLYQGDGENLGIGNPQHLAYVLYTSGSTGKPKGVMIQHDSSMNILHTLQSHFPIEEGDAYLLKTNYCFDVSVIELFAWFVEKAGRLVILKPTEEREPKKIISIVKKESVTHINFVPSMLQVFMDFIDEDNTGDLKILKYVIAGGEALTKELTNQFYQKTEEIRLENIYGPTESTIYATKYTVKEKEEGLIPIGKPVPNNQIYILNPANQLVPIGVPGELWIAGDGLGRGYLKQPQLTKERYTDNPFKVGGRIYRTGDLARWLPDGNIQYLGRIDHQVKIRGYRIELGEIENSLLQHESIKEAIVVTRTDDGGTPYLCGYITLVENKERILGDLSAEEIKVYLGRSLPDYMVPAYIMILDNMPLNANGKTDRKALPEPTGTIKIGGQEYIPPRDELDQKLVAIWEELLGIEGIGIKDHFFQLGGHSLKATSMMAKIQRELDIEIPMGVIFQNPTLEAIADYIRTTAKENRNINSDSTTIPLQRVAEREYYPLSSAQRRIYTLQQFDPQSLSYNMPAALMLEGAVDRSRIEDACGKLIERHEALRTAFVTVEEEPQQQIQNQVEFQLEIFEVEGGEEGLDNITQAFVRPFDLKKAPLFRVALVKITSQKYLMLIDMHHIISDGTSMGILIKEFTEIYRGTQLGDLKIQYKDYSVWQQQLFASGKLEKQKEYWLKQFKEEVPVLNLLGDHPRPTIQSFEGASLTHRIKEDLTEGLREVCHNTGATLYMVLLASFNVLLHKYTSQKDIVVGSPIAGRQQGDLEDILGMFVNTLAMRNYPTGEKTFREFLDEVKTNALRAYENQDYQFEELVENLDLKRDISRNPLFDVMFTMQNMELGKLHMEGLSIKPHPLQNTISKFDMTLSAIENEAGIDLALEYATKIFHEETIKRLFKHLENLLYQVMENIDVKLSMIHLTTKEEEQQLLYEFNDTKADYPKDKTIQQLFEEQVEKTPDAIAIVFEGSGITYRELNKRANQIASLLIEKGIVADTIVGIMMERSIEMMVGILGVLKAGGAYLPIDPVHPDERIQYMLEDSKTKLLLTQRKLRERKVFEGEIINLDEDDLYRNSGSNLNTRSNATSLAYIIYTSGSTGTPKGVAVEHRALNNFIETFYLNLKKDVGIKDRCLSLTSIGFDVSVAEMFLPLRYGASLVLFKNEEILDINKLVQTIKDEGITFTYIPPTILQDVSEALLKVKDDVGLNKILVGVEPIKDDILDNYLKVNPNMKIINGYGPTEATICATMYEFKNNQAVGRNIPIGKPLLNSKIYILNNYNQLMPIGVAGEICITGDGLARGYLNRPELTVDKFVDNPFAEGERMYRTGDLARWLPDGNIEFLGRIDQQVKIRGYRIEMGEIEANLSNHRAVKDVVVTYEKKEESQSEGHLYAYILLEEEITSVELKEYLAQKVPNYMIPTYFIKIDKVPLTSNGKVDKKALTSMRHQRMESGIQYVSPRNPLENDIAEVWREVLKIEEVGIHNNFFDLGGNSVDLIKVNTKLEKRLNQQVSVMTLFKHSTIASLALHLQSHEAATTIEEVKEERTEEIKKGRDRLRQRRGKR